MLALSTAGPRFIAARCGRADPRGPAGEPAWMTVGPPADAISTPATPHTTSPLRGRAEAGVPREARQFQTQKAHLSSEGTS
jgi:hypothetical protein